MIDLRYIKKPYMDRSAIKIESSWSDFKMQQEIFKIPVNLHIVLVFTSTQILQQKEV
jgi:hypothetical protein